MFNSYTRTIFVNLHGESLYVTILHRGDLMIKDKHYVDRVDRTQIPVHLRHLSDRRLKALQGLFKGRFTWMSR